MKTEFYKQCILERRDNSSITRTISWIPEKFAIEGKILKLKDYGAWTDGWKVVAAFSRTKSGLVEKMQHNSKDIWTATSGPDPRGNK